MNILKFFKTIFILILLTISLTAEELKKVNLQLQWKYQFQFAGYIMAKEKGFYKDVGLDVNIKEWNHKIDMVEEVVNGNSHYGVSRPTSMIDISKGKDIVYLAVIFQSSPLILLADKSSGITTVKDFVGKKMMSTGDMNTDTSFISMMMSQGVDIKKMTIQKLSFDVKDLMNGTTDLMASYVSNEPFVLQEMGGKPVIFSPKDYGFDFYNDIVIVGRAYQKENPIEVKNFKEATLKGWEYAFSNIDETVDVILKKYNSQNKSKDALVYEGKELKKLAYYKTGKIGKIEIEKLEKIYDIYKLLGLVKNHISFNRVVYNEQTLDVELNVKEKEYLHDKGSITMCIDPNWMPFEKFDEDGNHVGMSADYFKFFEKTLDTKFEVIKTSSWSESIEYAKQRKCDIFSLAMETPERKKYMNFTTPYLKIPLVITTKLDVAFVNEIKDLVGKKVGIPKGYAFAELLKNKYFYLDIVEVENIDDGLDKVNNGEIYAYIGTLASVGYKFQTKYSGELKIAGKIDDNWELGVGVRNDDSLLLTILQKAVNSIKAEERREVLNRWISIKYEKGIDYTLVYKTIIVSMFIILVILFFLYRQKNLKDKLQEAYKKLEELAVRDKLTNLYNRHKLDETLETEIKRSQRYSTTFGVIILDIDYFKNVNDTYGHHVGDMLLKELALIVSKHSREVDIVGRWGGEEFLIIVPQTDKESILRFAQSLRKAVEDKKFEWIGSMTISIGATVYQDSDTTISVVKRADEALYVSKNAGRNQVSYK